MTMFDEMMSRYVVATETERQNALHEVMQQVVLAGLYRGGFFERAAFYCGTCQRIFHGLERFSEDMDFSLVTKDKEFDLESYFPAIIEEFKLLGREVDIHKKDKQNFGKVEFAFLKDNTEHLHRSLCRSTACSLCECRVFEYPKIHNKDSESGAILT